MAIAVPTFLTLALGEIRAVRAGDVVSANDMDLALQLFNELLEAWSASDRAPYSVVYTTSTITPGLNPHLIGPTGTATFIQAERPTEIPAMDVVIQNNIRLPLAKQDRDWWMGLVSPAITASIPVSYYYEQSWGNGQIFLYPVPSIAYSLYYTQAVNLASVALTDTLDLPQGYQQALRLTLAEMLAPSFNQTISPSTAQKAIEARGVIFGNNDRIPILNTCDAGMPSGPSLGGKGLWNRLTGMNDA